MDKAGLKDKPVIGIIGDSTFFHSGITGLLELSYNKGISTIVIVDNRATAMTGLQEHPGTGCGFCTQVCPKEAIVPQE